MFATAVAFALLPTVAVAASGYEDVPVVEEASAELQGDHLATEITTTLPVFREDIRVKIDGRNVVVYVNGASIQGGKHTFGEGPGAIHALPRSSYAKLEVPMPAGQTCALPATVAIDEGLIHVSVGCRAGGAPAKAAAVTAAATTAPATKEIAHLAAKPAHKAVGHEVADGDPTPVPLRGLLGERAAAAPKERSLAASGGSVVAAEAKSEAAPAKPDAPVPAPVPSVTAVDKPAAHRPESNSPMLVGGALVLATVAAFFLWRRRRDPNGGLIRILETASLGPKRSLIVAEIDGEKMILGTSEAGISVLTPLSRMPSPWGEATGATRVQLPPGFAETSKISNIGNIAAAAAHHAASVNAAGPAPQTLSPADENEGGLLSRLFRRNAAPEIDLDNEVEGLGNMADEFQDLLADSIEDEELRRRLQAGIGGRTS